MGCVSVGPWPPAQALADLTEISSQIEAPSPSTARERSRLDGGRRARPDARARPRELLGRPSSGAQTARSSRSSTSLSRDGSVFVVRDGERLIAATTAPSRPSGLVFYDLKSACAAWAGAEPKPKPRAAKRAAPKKKADAGRNFLTGFLLAAGSAAGTVLYRRRAARRRERVELYFGDGSMVSLTEGSPEAERLLGSRASCSRPRA